MNPLNIWQKKGFILIIALICMLLWGSAVPVLKICFWEMDLQKEDFTAKIFFAGMRFFAASMLLFLISQRQRHSSNHLSLKNHCLLFLLGFLQTSLQYFFYYNGLAHTSGIKGVVIASSSVFFVMLFSRFLFPNDFLTPLKAVGALFGLAGIIVLNIDQEIAWNFTLPGEGFLLLSGIISAWGTLLAKKISPRFNALSLTAWQMFWGSSLLLFLGSPQASIVLLSFNFFVFFLFLYSAIISAIAFSLWYQLLKYNNAGEISIYRFLIPLFGSILSLLFLPNEKITIFLFWGTILVSLGIYLVNRSTKPKFK